MGRTRPPGIRLDTALGLTAAALAALACAGSLKGDPARSARRQLAAGQPADLVLLDRPWREARARLDARDVAATLVAGEIVWSA